MFDPEFFPTPPEVINRMVGGVHLEGMTVYEPSAGEAWKPVNGFEGSYEISNHGRLRSIDRYVSGKNNSKRFQKGIVQKPEVTRKGYLRYTMSIARGKSVRKLAHVLVGEHFIDKPDDKDQINHIDGVKSNNSYTNLEWVTGIENIRHAWDQGLMQPNYGVKKPKRGNSPGAKKVRSICVLTGKNKIHDCIKDASDDTGVSKNAISRYLNGKVKNPRKYRFIEL